MGDVNGLELLFESEDPSVSSSSLGRHIKKPALPQRISQDQSSSNQNSSLGSTDSFRNGRNGEDDVIEDKRADPQLDSQGQEPSDQPWPLDGHIRRRRLSPGASEVSDISAKKIRSLENGDPAILPDSGIANDKPSPHFLEGVTSSQPSLKPFVTQKDSEVLKGNSFKTLSIPDSQISFQDPFSDRISPVQLRVRTDLLRKSHHHHHSRDKARSLPSSPTGKKPSNAARRGTVQSAVESQAKRKIQAAQPLNSHSNPSGESTIHQMNRAAKLSIASNDSLISAEEDLPLPPFSIPTYLDLELSSHKPPSQYIRPSPDFVPFESSKVKLEKLVNFLILPMKLELFIGFGTLVCFDSWLYMFTILPLRFCKAVWILCRWLKKNAIYEIADLGTSISNALAKIWHQQRVSKGLDLKNKPSSEKISNSSRHHVTYAGKIEGDATTREDRQPSILRRKPASFNKGIFKHKRTRSIPSALAADHKADLLKGLLFTISCVFLTQLDASRMYHNIRGQATIKLYVIYNVLEVCDRLLSALGQDVMECLLSSETLERNSRGRSKVLRPLGIFTLALVYNVLHSAALLYQVITLNVAVNSYSNALLTLLLSNQFVEIKGTVFKKIEKENLFQLTCADVVERFQMWLMLIIIAMRNFIEVGAINDDSHTALATSTLTAPISNASGLAGKTSSILPQSFTLLPSWAGSVLGPFFLVLGSEMLVDWLKHAYITKFNNTKPAIYERFLDVAAKDYYSHAFVDQNLTRRLGLPVLPLACLFMRAALQIYRMFIATQNQAMHYPFSSHETSLSSQPTTESPSAVTMAAFAHIDQVIRQALGRSTFGIGSGNSLLRLQVWSKDDIVMIGTTLTFLLIAYLVLLALKTLLGICILTFARQRYRGMKRQSENESYTTGGKKIGGWGLVDVNEEKRMWIYADDPNGAHAIREREARAKEKDSSGVPPLDGVSRFSMVSKRIW